MLYGGDYYSDGRPFQVILDDNQKVKVQVRALYDIALVQSVKTPCMATYDIYNDPLRQHVFYSKERWYGFGMINATPNMYGTKPYGTSGYAEGITITANQRAKVVVQATFDVTRFRTTKVAVRGSYDITSLRGVRVDVAATYDISSYKKVKVPVQAVYEIQMPEAPTPQPDPTLVATDFSETFATALPDFREVS